VTAKEQIRSSLDVDRRRAEMPEVVEKYSKVTSSRPLRVTQRKGDV